MSQQLAVIVFDQQLKAQEFATAMLRLQTEEALLLHDLVFVSKDADGRVRVVETTDPSVGQSALSGALWGALFGALLFVPVVGLAAGAAGGALTAKLIDTGISDEFVTQLRDAVHPGSTAVAVLAGHIKAEAVLAELQRFEGGQYIAGNLPEESVAAVKAALGEAVEGSTAGPGAAGGSEA